MKTKDERLLPIYWVEKLNEVLDKPQSNEKRFHDVANLMLQYSDQNIKPLVECLKELMRVYLLFNDIVGMVSIEKEAINKAKKLLSQYDKENDCV